YHVDAARRTMSTSSRHIPAITVGNFYANHAEHLDMRLTGAAVGMNRIIKEPTINRPGLALTGFYSYFAGKRMQVIGSAELSYLKNLPVQTMLARVRDLFSHKIPCLVIARNAKLPPAILDLAAEFEIPVFRTQMITMKFINAATIALEFEFAPTSSEYGSMVDIHGIGVLIRGSSGVGKSECVLGLIERGYSLISDDITRIRQVEGRELIGTAAEISRYHMEVRGIGIINVAAVFGIGSVRPDKRLDMVVTLKDWHEVEDVDRLGTENDFYEILGIQVPHVIVPVRTGRDIARLVEVAALDQKLKSMGHNSAREFNQRLIQFMRKKN
ncbi:MAG: HPr(Ser) kinase/phosphatase, partial [Chthoniobacterales bacterium]